MPRKKIEKTEEEKKKEAQFVRKVKEDLVHFYSALDDEGNEVKMVELHVDLL